jgi:hypothetical protein
MKQNQNQEYSAKETQRRYKAALQGAFNTPATPLKSMKRPKAQPATAKKKPGK